MEPHHPPEDVRQRLHQLIEDLPAPVLLALLALLETLVLAPPSSPSRRCGEPQPSPQRFAAQAPEDGRRAASASAPAYSTDFCHPVHGNIAMQSMGMLPPSPEDCCHPVHGNVATLGA